MATLVRLCGPAACAILLCAQSPVEPARFAPGVVPNNALGLAFSRDGKTLYFSQSQTRILTSRFENGTWTAPVPMPFSGDWRDGDPFLSPDGSQLFFWSSRPLDGKQRRGLALWVSERTPGGWSEPKDLGPVINGPDGGSIFPSVTRNGTLYFASGRPGSLGRRDIYRAKKTADGYAEPENLGPGVNSARDEWDAYVSPDESTLIFASERDGAPELYLSRQKDGVWSAPRSLRSATGGRATCCPAVSPDGEYFFFSGPGGIYRTAMAALSGQAADPPKLFAEGIISMPGSFAITFSPDGKAAFFSETSSALMTSRLENGAWSPAAPLFPSARNTDMIPFLAPGGAQLYFSSNRVRQGMLLFTSERTASGWGTPRELGAPINVNVVMNGAGSFASNGTLYYSARLADSSTSLDLYHARRTAAGFAEPENLGPVVNSAAEDREVYVAPDESFLIFTSGRPGGQGGPDLYISTRRDGAWTAPRNLGPPINTPGQECCATLSPDGKTLYFIRAGSGAYQVSAAALGLDR